MELSAVGESVFAAESIIKRRIRRVRAACLSSTRRFKKKKRRAALDRDGAMLAPELSACVFIFAGSLGISREMEGLVAEVSIDAQDRQDTALHPGRCEQLHHLTLLPIFIYLYLRAPCHIQPLFCLFWLHAQPWGSRGVGMCDLCKSFWFTQFIQET